MSGSLTDLRQEFTAELESILESDEAYGSNLQILTYSLKDESINGKFKDSWNNRVYEFVIDIDGINYKPAAKLDSFSADEAPVRFDLFSEGYASLFEDVRLDLNPTGKRTKKPKCGAEGYGCGYSCIGLLKTCRILSFSKKAGTNQGKAIGQQRLNKLMALSKKLYLAGDQKGAALASATATNIQNIRTKYTGGGQASISERALAKQKKQEVKSPTKPQEKQLVEPKSESTKSTLDPTTNPKTHSIKTQKEFEDVILHVIDKVNKEGKHDGLVPIHEVRQTVGELVPRDKFKEFMRSMQGDSESITMIGGEMKGITPERQSNSLTTPTGELRYYVKLTPTGQDQLKELSSTQQTKVDKLLKDRPELDPLGTARKYATGPVIVSQKEFEATLTNVYKALNDEFNHDNLVPISRVREVLKDRTPKDSFEKMIKEAQDNGYTLIGGGDGTSEELREGGIKTKLGAERHYIKKEN